MLCSLSADPNKNNLPIGSLFRTVKDYETGAYPTPGIFHLTQSCNHCENPACVIACPTGAMYKDEETGVVLHDDDMCIGCASCANACPYHQPKLLEDIKKVHKCDSCIAIRKEGGQLQCVASCVMRAIEFGDIDELKAAHPDAVSIAELPMMPEICALTNPNTIVSVKANVADMAVEKAF